MLLWRIASGIISVLLLSLFLLINNLPHSVANFGGNCTNDYNCTTPNETCSNKTETLGVCLCAGGFYNNMNSGPGGICEQKVGLGSNCTQPDACNDTNAMCNSGGKCICGSGYYDNNGVNISDGTCTAKVGLGSNCTQPDACNDTNAMCNSGGKCICGSGYYDNNGVNISDGTCTAKVGLGTLCPQPDACGTAYAFCEPSPSNVKTCVCSADFYDSDGVTLGGTCNNGPSIPGALVQNTDIDASSGNITLQWNSSIGVVTGYIGFLQNTTLFAYNKTFNKSGITPSQSFSELKNGAWYMFNVQAVSGYPDTRTLYSEVYTEFMKTKVQAPEPPYNIQCSQQNDKDILLKWDAPLNPNGDLRRFIINVNRIGPTPGNAYNVTTSTADFLYKVENLTEGSVHIFQIYTVNEQFESTRASEKQSCETKAVMSEPPTYINQQNVTSRSFTVSWKQPINVFGELVGYILIINNTETKDCVVEEFTNCSTGCTHAFPDQTVVSPTCSQITKYQGIVKTELHQTRNYSASFGTFNPDTVYTVSIAAVNQGGKGNTDAITVMTLEEVPQRPYNIQAIDTQASSAAIRWIIDGPRPGKTTYTITITGKSPAENMTHTVSGFSNTSFNITGLQEYWNYTLIVTANTTKGSNSSDSFSLSTKIAPAGKVSKFTVEQGSGSDLYVTSRVSWSLPAILEMNGPIQSFIVQQEEMVNGTFTEISKRNVTSANDGSNTYNIDFQVQRVKLYQFKVFAYNGFDGDVSSMNFSASPVQTPSSVGALAGGITGGLAALIVIAVIFIFLWRRKRNKLKKTKGSSNDVTESSVDDLTKIRKERPINLATFAEYVADYHKDSNLKFSEEYLDLKTLSPQHSHEAADMEENRLKNRFVNILPFDHSRVKLLPIDDVPGSDYINANYLPGFTRTREYIACQGPISATVDDHWRLIWEQNVCIIVMLTQYKEGNRVKCEQYIPLELKDPKQYGDLVIECLTYSSLDSFEYRTLKVTLEDKERTIKHFHFLRWHDYSANVELETMIDFIKKVHNFIQPPDLEGPLIVHCSAGVGRTGTFITLDYVIQHIDKYGPDSTVDIFNFVLKLRENRTTMVQTEQQYIFIHDCIKEYLNRFQTYENQGFGIQDENVYQNTEPIQVYENFNLSSFQKTKL